MTNKKNANHVRSIKTSAMEGTEVVKKRGINTKVYSLGRGVSQYVVFPEAVHYHDADGGWKEINNTLEKHSEKGRTRFSTKANNVRFSFASSAKEKDLVKIVDNKGRFVSWSLEGANEVAVSVAADAEPQAAETDHNRRRQRQRNLESSVKYEDILTDVDMLCHIHGSQFKDEFILKTSAAPSAIVLNLEASTGIVWSSVDENTLIASCGDEAVFSIPPAYVYDAKGQAGLVHTVLLQNKTSNQLIFDVDQAWLAQAAYPVTIDPIVNTAEDSYIKSNYVSELNPNTVMADSANKLSVSSKPAGGNCRAFIKLTQLPELSSAYTIMNATITLKQASTAVSSFPVFYKEVIEDWSADTITWNNQPAVADMDTGCFDTYQSTSDANYVSVPINGVYTILLANGPVASADNTHELDITKLVRKWYQGSNYGIRLDARKVSNQNTTVNFYSAEHAKNKPVITITCVANAGIVGHIPYEGMGAGSAGSGSVNLYNGNFVFSNGITSTAGLRMPVSLTATYNSCELETQETMIPMGQHGWRMNYDLQVFARKIGTEVYYELVQGDGSRVDIRRKKLTDKIYYDNLGLGLSIQWGKTTLSSVRADYLNISDKFGVVMTFPWPEDDSMEGSLPISIADPRDSSIKFLYNGRRLEYIVDGVNRTTALRYQDGRLSRVIAPGETTGVSFQYDSEGYLTSITDIDGTQSVYTYEDGRLVSAESCEGLRLDCAYGETSPHRVSCLAQSGTDANGEMEGNRRSYEYDGGMTVVRDETVPDGKRKFYTFNDWGNQVGIRDELGFAGFTKYNPDGLPNHPEMTSKLLKTSSALYIEDSRFDTSPTFNCNFYSYDTATKYLGARSLKLTNTAGAGQKVLPYASRLLKAGKTYTFSAYMKTSGAVSCLAQAVVPSVGTVSGVGQQSTDEWVRVSVTFDIPDGIGGANNNVSVDLKFVVTEGAGNAWLDCVQLELSETAGKYNLLSNTGFYDPSLDNLMGAQWVALADNTASDTVIIGDNMGKPDCLTPGVLRIYGDAEKTKGFYQELAISGAKDDAFVFGGWAHCYATPTLVEERKCGIRISFKTGTSTWKDGGSANWNDEWSQWQFIGGAAFAPAAYTAVRFYVEYEKNINHMDTDGFMLHKESFGKVYGYDETGNILNMTDLSSKQMYATYDKYNNLLSYRGVGKTTAQTHNFTYDGAKRLMKTSTSPVGTKCDYQYDAHGNMTQERNVYSITTTSEYGVETTETYAITNRTEYTADGNRVTRKLDAFGKVVSFDKDACRDTLSRVEDPNGQSILYEYDKLKRLTRAESEQDGKLYVNEYMYENNRPKTVSHNTTTDTPDVTYSFEYDALGNPTDTYVGTQRLSRNVYSNTPDRKLERLEYGNGAKVHYAYDEYKRLKVVRHDTEVAPCVEYFYGDNGKLTKLHDLELSQVAEDEYDGAERLVIHRLYGVDANGGSRGLLSKHKIEYDGCNRVSKVTETLESGAYETTYTYAADDAVTKVQFGATSTRNATYTYGNYRRLDKIATPMGNRVITYAPGGYGTNSQSARITKITELGKTWEYGYNDVGSIISEKRDANASKAVTYEYDKLGQLNRVNDQVAGFTWTYQYDQGGNILNREAYAYTTGSLASATPLTTDTYAYADANWKDKLTSFNGQAITYDAIGNPLRDGNWTYTWRKGRQLERMQNSGHVVGFGYNYEGLRIKKVADGIETRYTVCGKNITHITRGALNMHFHYGADDKPVLVAYNGVDYYYVYNLQGDVVGLANASKKLVVEYTYDPWGMPLTLAGTMAATLGLDNPYRYRSYVYDDETGLYYLRARYYNPALRRFINADAVLGSIGRLPSHNPFVYCINNPVDLIDPTGCSPSAAAMAAAMAAAIAAAAAIVAAAAVAIAAAIATKAAAAKAAAAKAAATTTTAVELLSDEDIWRDFSSGERNVEVTDLITKRVFNAEWKQDAAVHAHLWFGNNDEDKNPNWLGGWSKDARPIVVTMIDDSGRTRNIAYGWIPYPHKDNWQEKPVRVDSEMCIFNGSSALGYGRDYGNEAAYGALNGDYRIFPSRPPQ